jgi:hypothetical protein
MYYDYDLFLLRLRDKIMELVRDGHLVTWLMIYPERNGQRTVTAYCQNEAEPFVWEQPL